MGHELKLGLGCCYNYARLNSILLVNFEEQEVCASIEWLLVFKAIDISYTCHEDHNMLLPSGKKYYLK